MQPKIELTDQRNFAGWESGSFNTKFNVGSSVLIAGPSGDKLKVIFDRPASRLTNQKHHFLFIMEVGNLIAQAFINKVYRVNRKPVYKVRLVLSVVTALTTESVQGHSTPTAKTEVKWAYQAEVSSTEEALVLADYNDSVVGYTEANKNLLRAALEKALTPREQQRLFWGQPRTKAVEYA